MEPQNMRMAGMTIGAAMLLCGLVTTPIQAQVSINVNIGPPAPVIVQAPPPMLFLPDPGIYVAVGTPYDLFFMGGRYYYLYGDHWFWGSGYGGPWTYVNYQTLPPGLRKFKVTQLREYREREYRVYKAEGRDFRGKRFYAEAAGPKVREIKEHDNGAIKEHDNSKRSKGKKH